MKSCPTMIDVGRRKFLTGAGVAAAGVAASAVMFHPPQRRRRLPASVIRPTGSRT